MELPQEQSGIIQARPAGEQTGFYVAYGKRALDTAIAALVLLATAPILAIIALAIKRDSPGPVLFSQARVGKDGVPFQVLKFRTMRVDNDDTIHQQHIQRLIAENCAPAAGTSLKLQQDPRITRVGAFLRRTSLDELPQFANVLRGEMSVVGPRPDVPYAVANYKPWYHGRTCVRPGITGLWQVEARNRVSYEAMIRMDIDYCARQSFWLDLDLMLRTPLAMISGDGAG